MSGPLLIAVLVWGVVVTAIWWSVRDARRHPLPPAVRKAYRAYGIGFVVLFGLVGLLRWAGVMVPLWASSLLVVALTVVLQRSRWRIES